MTADKTTPLLAPARAPIGAAATAAGAGLLTLALLYACGYVVLRFRLEALGLDSPGSPLHRQVWDAGLVFLLDLLGSISVVALFVLALALLCLPYRLLPGRWRAAVHKNLAGRRERFQTRWSTPGRLALAGTVLATATIELALRPSFGLKDVLLAVELPAPLWLQPVLLARGLALPLYLAVVLSATAVSGRLAWMAWKSPGHSSRSVFLAALLSCLVAVEVAWLPAGYGTLTSGRDVARVEAPWARRGEDVWLLWRDRDRVAYLVRTSPLVRSSPASSAESSAGALGAAEAVPPPPEGREESRRQLPTEARRLVVVPRGDGEEMEVLCREPLLRRIYRQDESPCEPPHV